MAGVARSRGRYAKTADRRTEILAATVAVFAESGFHGGSIREIAERVGISQAGLLHHFANKESLLEAVLSQRDALARERMGPQLPTGRALLEAFVELIAYNATTPGLVALYSVLSGEATGPDHPGHAYFRSRYGWVLDLVTEAIRAGQRDGEVRPDVDPEVAGRTIIALSDGLQVQWLYEDGGFDLAGPVKAYVESLLSPARR
jgi:AcrR family transcriptional regulator